MLDLVLETPKPSYSNAILRIRSKETQNNNSKLNSFLVLKSKMKVMHLLLSVSPCLVQIQRTKACYCNKNLNVKILWNFYLILSLISWKKKMIIFSIFFCKNLTFLKNVLCKTIVLSPGTQVGWRRVPLSLNCVF